jgi:hypothetical protein
MSSSRLVSPLSHLLVHEPFRILKVGETMNVIPPTFGTLARQLEFIRILIRSILGFENSH